jgi:hypothetical protein
LTEGGLLANIYPNPAVDKLNVDFITSAAGMLKITLYDIAGEKLKEMELPSGPVSSRTSIDVSGLAPGIYFVIICSPSGSITKKLVRQ